MFLECKARHNRTLLQAASYKGNCLLTWRFRASMNPENILISVDELDQLIAEFVDARDTIIAKRNKQRETADCG